MESVVTRPEVKPTRDQFKSYVCEQARGRYNMLSRMARESVGVERETYDYILEHYAELSEEYGITTESEEVKSYVAIAEKWGF